MNTALQAAQVAYDYAVPPDYYEDAAAQERAVERAMSKYIDNGWLPDGQDPGCVFDDLSEREEGLLVCDMLKTYREGTDAELLAQCKRLMDMVEGIVLEKLEGEV